MGRWNNDRFRTRVKQVVRLLLSLDWGEQILKNLRSDRQIDNGLRRKLARRLCLPLRLERDWLEERFRNFCYAHQRLGSEIKGPDRLHFGHVRSRNKLAAQLVGDGKQGVTRSTAPQVVSGLLGVSLADQKRRLASLLRDGILSEHQMFSTYNLATPETPFQGVTCRTADLIRLLALSPLDAMDVLVYWSHSLATDTKAHIPTTFDGELNPGFRPGGRTAPADGSPGLLEAVHEPVTAAELATPIRMAP